MAALQDLTWTQVQTAFMALGYGNNVVTLDSYGIAASINPSQVLSVGNTTRLVEGGGVIEFVVKLLEACRIAQERANGTLPTAEKLTSFPSPTIGGTIVNNFVPLSRSVVGKYDQGTVTNIIGMNP